MAGGLIPLSMLLAACGGDDVTPTARPAAAVATATSGMTAPPAAEATPTVHHQTPSPTGGMGMADEVTSETGAAALRAQLTTLLQEHVYLGGAATGAALAGREAEFEVAAATLDCNSVELSEAIGAAYGPEAEAAFLPGWRAHVGFFVDYTNCVATDDMAAQEKAVADRTQYAADFAAFLNSANGLPLDVVESLVMGHVVGLKGVVDAQAAGDAAVAYGALRAAAMHMSMLADPLAEATVQAFPDAFSG